MGAAASHHGRTRVGLLVRASRWAVCIGCDRRFRWSDKHPMMHPHLYSAETGLQRAHCLLGRIAVLQGDDKAAKADLPLAVQEVKAEEDRGRQRRGARQGTCLGVMPLSMR